MLEFLAETQAHTRRQCELCTDFFMTLTFLFFNTENVLFFKAGNVMDNEGKYIIKTFFFISITSHLPSEMN